MRVQWRLLVPAGLAGLLLVADATLLVRRSRYKAETARLRSGMTDLERKRADALISQDAEHTMLLVQLLKRQAAGDNAIHLAVNTDSGYMALDRGPARLRTMAITVGEERRVGVPPDTIHMATPRGTRVIEQLLGPKDLYELPAWVWSDQGLEADSTRSGPGWTGPQAIVTSGGVLIYSLPGSGPLADSAYVPPGSIRVSADDLKAIRENLSLGTKVYFF